MNVGMVLDNTFPPDPRVENEALSLISKGHRVYLYCLDYDHAQEEYEFYKGIHICRQRLPGYLYYLSALAYTIPYYHLCLRKSIKHFLFKNNIQEMQKILPVRSLLYIAISNFIRNCLKMAGKPFRINCTGMLWQKI